MKSDKSKHKSSSHKPPSPVHDSEGRMGSPVAGNPAQRKQQVQHIANDVMGPDSDVEQEEDQDDTSQGDPLFQGNMPSQASASPLTHDHTVHDHKSGKSTTHSVPHGADCPACGTSYMPGIQGGPHGR